MFLVYFYRMGVCGSRDYFSDKERVIMKGRKENISFLLFKWIGSMWIIVGCGGVEAYCEK